MMSMNHYQSPAELKSTTMQDPFIPCHVCGEKAGKHSYYGGQVELDFEYVEAEAFHVFSGVPLLQSILSTIGTVWLQPNLCMCEVKDL